MNIVLIAGTYPPKQLDEIISQHKIDVAACAFAWKFVQGLSEMDQVDLKLINERHLPLYPKHKPAFLKRELWQHEESDYVKQGKSDIHFAFWNFPIIKRLSKASGIKKELKHISRANEQADVLLVYSVHTPYLLPAVRMKSKLGAKICLIVPDLPAFMSDLSKQPIKRFFKSIDARLQKKLLAQVDSFVFLTDQMPQKLGIINKPYTIIEGMVSRDEMQTFDTQIDPKQKRDWMQKIDPDKPFLLYTGAIAQQYGLIQLLEAFEAIDQNKTPCQLVICGLGDAKPIIEKHAKNNSDLIFLGQVPRKQALFLQQQAALLVNPRGSQDEYTRYSFPSKTMEYMLSGTPVMMSKLMGMPEEYEQHLFLVQDESVTGWAKAIEAFLLADKQAVAHQAKIAQEWMKKEKNQTKQVQKLVAMLEKEIKN